MPWWLQRHWGLAASLLPPFRHSRFSTSFQVWVRIWRFDLAATSSEAVVDTCWYWCMLIAKVLKHWLESQMIALMIPSQDLWPKLGSRTQDLFHFWCLYMLPLVSPFETWEEWMIGCPGAWFTQRLAGFLRFGGGDAWRGGWRRVDFSSFWLFGFCNVWRCDTAYRQLLWIQRKIKRTKKTKTEPEKKAKPNPNLIQEKAKIKQKKEATPRKATRKKKKSKTKNNKKSWVLIPDPLSWFHPHNN